MIDWNGDGKHDAKDDVFYHTVINNGNNNNSNPPPTGGGNNSGCFSSGPLVLALGYLSILIPGKIPINGFTMFIGLICAIIVIGAFLSWLYG